MAAVEQDRSVDDQRLHGKLRPVEDLPALRECPVRGSRESREIEEVLADEMAVGVARNLRGKTCRLLEVVARGILQLIDGALANLESELAGKRWSIVVERPARREREVRP